MDGVFRAELYHKPSGFPLWYGREKPSHLTQHSITYGYNWAGEVVGTLWIDGKEIQVNGLGIRERYVAVDSSAAELGGWEDWGWFSFHEIHSSLYDMRLGMKDFSIYDLQGDVHYPEGTMTIEHEAWAFLRELDGLIPTVCQLRWLNQRTDWRTRCVICPAMAHLPQHPASRTLQRRDKVRNKT